MGLPLVELVHKGVDGSGSENRADFSRHVRWRHGVDEEDPRVLRRNAPRLRPQSPCIMQQAKVPCVVGEEYPPLLRCHEQLAVVGRPRQTDLPGRPHGVPGRLQTYRDCPGNVVVKVQVGQCRLPR